MRNVVKAPSGLRRRRSCFEARAARLSSLVRDGRAASLRVCRLLRPPGNEGRGRIGPLLLFRRRRRSRIIRRPFGERLTNRRRAVAAFGVRSVSLVPERKRQFAKPPLHPIRVDVRKILTVHTRCALVGAALGIAWAGMSSRLERLPGGTCTHWKAPPFHGAHP